MKGIRVRARQKAIADLPAWALCCASIREVYERQAVSGLEVTAIFPAFEAETECRFCHKITQGVQYVRTLENGRRRGAIPVDCFEFDEGLYRGGTPIATSGRGSELRFSR